MDRPDNANRTKELDLDLIAQQIQALSEIAAREHLESIERSQAKGLVEAARRATHMKSAATWRQ